MLAELLISPRFSFPSFLPSLSLCWPARWYYVFYITVKISTFSSLRNLPHMIFPHCYSLYSSSSSDAVHLHKLTIYHLLIHADCGAFLHNPYLLLSLLFTSSWQLSFRQPANRPVFVSQLRICCQPLALYIQERAHWSTTVDCWSKCFLKCYIKRSNPVFYAPFKMAPRSPRGQGMWKVFIRLKIGTNPHKWISYLT